MGFHTLLSFLLAVGLPLSFSSLHRQPAPFVPFGSESSRPSSLPTRSFRGVCVCVLARVAVCISCHLNTHWICHHPCGAPMGSLIHFDQLGLGGFPWRSLPLLDQGGKGGQGLGRWWHSKMRGLHAVPALAGFPGRKKKK